MPPSLHPPQLPGPPPPPFPHPSHQFPFGGLLPPPPLPFFSPPPHPPFPHIHPHLPSPLNAFLASAATALILQQQQQYQAALLQHFMAAASTPIHPFVAENNVAANGQTPRRRIKNEPAAGGANRQRANVATCEICGKSFGRPWLLNGHRRIHDGEKPYRCEWAGCGRAFADRSNYRAHERTHHPEKPHACHHCGKAFKLKSYLAKHIRANACRHHQAQKQQPKEDVP